jgi:hypothetical protein
MLDWIDDGDGDEDHDDWDGLLLCTTAVDMPSKDKTR